MKNVTHNMEQDDGFRLSRFVVDLKEQSGEPAAETISKKEKAKDYLVDFFDRPKPNLGRLKELAFVGVFAGLVKLFYRLCYAVGFGAAWIGRFVYLSFKEAGEAAWRGIKKIGSLFLVLRKAAAPEKEARLPTEEPREFTTTILENQSPLIALAGEPAPPRLEPALARLKKAAVFPIVLLLLVLPLKTFTYFKNLDATRGRVMASTQSALDDLFSGGRAASQLDLKSAADRFGRAGENFVRAQGELDDISQVLFALASLAPDKKLRLAADGDNILAAGQAAASLGRNLSNAMSAILDRPGEKPLTEALAGFTLSGRLAVGNAADLTTLLKDIKAENLPDEYRDKFTELRGKAAFLSASLGEFVSLVEKLNVFLGENDLKRYLLVFQNNTEARATGGFLGSFALVDLHDGRVKNIEAPGGGTYDTEAGLVERVVAPEPLWLLNPLWHFWDANWWPDWPTSARKIAWFYEKSDGPTVDGVISLTPDVLEKILKVTGPIDLTENYGLTITADNFFDTLQQLAEQKPEVTRKPKKIIGDLLDKIVAELPKRLDKTMLFGLINAVEASLNEKHILIYFKDAELEQTVKRYGWDGRLKETNWDYLMVVNTNIGGGKSDAKVRQTISHRAEILGNGEIIDTVTVKREHTGVKNEGFSGVRNVDWLRVYVPEGAELLDASGFVPPAEKYFSEPEAAWRRDADLAAEENAAVDPKTGTRIYREAGKTVFANWSMIDPGETATIYFKYKLPFRLEKPAAGGWTEALKNFFFIKDKNLYPYALYAQKQSGSPASLIDSTLAAANVFKPLWRWPETLGGGENGWQVKDELDTDKYWALVLEDK